jgi:RimJ/RimL family protein N-acetyltransferase
MAEDIAKLRALAAPLLTDRPSDALASYFALEHDIRRTKLVVRTDAQRRAVAFAAVCQTGLDLFRPLVVMRGDDSAALQDAVHEALAPRRQYLFNAPPTLKPDLEAVAVLNGESLNAIYTLGSNDFKPIVNILVQTSHTPDGLLRASIKARDGSNAAEAGTSWISSRYAEVFVQVAAGARNRGLGKSVVSAVSAQVIEMQRTPLYVAGVDNTVSRRLAERLGYRDTGAFELSGALSRRD